MVRVAPPVSPLESLVGGDVDVLEVVVRAVAALSRYGQGPLCQLWPGVTRDTGQQGDAHCSLQSRDISEGRRRWALPVCTWRWRLSREGPAWTYMSALQPGRSQPATTKLTRWRHLYHHPHTDLYWKRRNFRIFFKNKCDVGAGGVAWQAVWLCDPTSHVTPGDATLATHISPRQWKGWLTLIMFFSFSDLLSQCSSVTPFGVLMFYCLY